MESIADKLRTAREEKGYSLEQVARDTHIAKRYITAMEQEDFSVFPGETYAIGFLKNYSAYLGLNPNELVALYRNIKLQEQPAPMDELLDNRRRPGPLAIVLIVVVVIGIVVAGLLLFTDVFAANAAPPGGSSVVQAAVTPVIAFGRSLSLSRAR